MYIELLKEMFERMVISKDASLIPKYFHPDFLLSTNQREMNYSTFLEAHKSYYSTSIEHSIEYDEATLVEQGNKLAGRLWITTTRPGEPTRKTEVMLIAEYRENKIYRLWELTHPDWSQLPAFDGL